MTTEIATTENRSLLTLPPREMIEAATEYAEVLADVIEKQKLYTVIQGKKYVRVDGWLTLGTMLGFTAREKRVTKLEDGSYEAEVELIRYSDGVVLGGASALCSVDEKRWGSADAYARRSMSITRAVGKAYRINFSWVLSLAGYEVTPEEEMPESKEPRKEKIELYTGTVTQQKALQEWLDEKGIKDGAKQVAFEERMMNRPKKDAFVILKEFQQ